MLLIRRYASCRYFSAGFHYFMLDAAAMILMLLPLFCYAMLRAPTLSYAPPTIAVTFCRC